MDPRGAALAAEPLGVKHVIPIHYGIFPILAGNPDHLRTEFVARGLGDVEVHAPEPGTASAEPRGAIRGQQPGHCWGRRWYHSAIDAPPRTA